MGVLTNLVGLGEVACGNLVLDGVCFCLPLVRVQHHLWRQVVLNLSKALEGIVYVPQLKLSLATLHVIIHDGLDTHDVGARYADLALYGAACFGFFAHLEIDLILVLPQDSALVHLLALQVDRMRALRLGLVFCRACAKAHAKRC